MRATLVDAISANKITTGGKELRARVQDSPNMQATRSHYWRAVDAIKKHGTEGKDFILVPRSFGIHEAQGIELMGNITENGYVWNDEIVKKAIPSVNLIQLKKESLNKKQRR